jgi:hypothetical protein
MGFPDTVKQIRQALVTVFMPFARKRVLTQTG